MQGLIAQVSSQLTEYAKVFRKGLSDYVWRGLMRSLIIFGCTLLLAMPSHGLERGFDFSQGGDQIVVRVKLQEDLKLRQMKAIYRSRICTFLDYSASGVASERDGYNNTILQPYRDGESDNYKAILVIDGGGECQWKLSNLTFGVDYKYPERFGKDVQVAGAGGITVVFDDNQPQQGGSHRMVEGDLNIVEDYYLLVSDRPGRHPRINVGLTAEDGVYPSYKAKAARVINFEPRLHSSYVTYSSRPEVKAKGGHVKFTYPDGSVVADGRVRPDFKKLQCIRLPSECGG